ncbi:Rrf2 family protein [Neorhizobium huautlense]|uniref:Rrf2 family protein n=1 Tax=Neorhizobium huautlense TaxID=67774 RepID=A0ABT9PMN1_9HYPH|nr:Rrf2 family transcriptional regulator [Neorhizobium huautlense]MDP9835702.1 Rrf2 family protein [Neorhizobium huautlense]
MRLTRQTEIAISILISCARRQSVIDTELAADEAQATKDHAAQILKRMVQAGWIETRRGRGGGLSLKVPAEDLHLGNVVATMQPGSLGSEIGASDIKRVLMPVLEEANAAVRDLLDCYTIADLAESCPRSTLEPKRSRRAFDIPAYRSAEISSRHRPENIGGVL